MSFRFRLLITAVLFLSGFCLASSPSGSRGMYHTVKQGDTLDTLARSYRVPAYEIARENRLSVNARVHPGSRLYIPSVRVAPTPAPKPSNSARRISRTPAPPPRSSGGSGNIVVQKGETLWGIANRNHLSVAELAKFNNIKSNAVLQVGQKLVLPGGPTSFGPSFSASSVPAATSKPRQVAQARATPKPRLATQQTSNTSNSTSSTRSSQKVSKQGFIWPVNGPVTKAFTDKSDTKHFGLDIRVPVGTPVRAAKSGEVVYVGRIPAYGNMVIISHSGGLATCYAYNRETKVREKQKVKQGDVIATSGDPGKSDFPCFHFQIRRNGDALNPLPYLP